MIVHIKGFADSEGDVMESDYFARDDRQNITWTIQVQGAKAAVPIIGVTDSAAIQANFCNHTPQTTSCSETLSTDP